MWNSACHKIFIILSVPLIIFGVPVFDNVVPDAMDGEVFLEKLIKNQPLEKKPEVLMFTAPFKLCEGGCKENEEEQFIMKFPLYIGTKAVQEYDKTTQPGDTKDPNKKGPFGKKTTKPVYTTCPDVTTTTTSTICPMVPYRSCMKTETDKQDVKTGQSTTESFDKISLEGIDEDDYLENLRKGNSNYYGSGIKVTAENKLGRFEDKRTTDVAESTEYNFGSSWERVEDLPSSKLRPVRARVESRIDEIISQLKTNLLRKFKDE